MKTSRISLMVDLFQNTENVNNDFVIRKKCQIGYERLGWFIFLVTESELLCLA